MLSFIFLPEWLDTYFNYPGLEIWKFLDLAIFLTAAIYILKKPISQTLATRRETIRRQILEAEEERDRAAGKLAEAEAKLARVDQEVESLRKLAREEAELERKRQAAAAEQEMQRLKTQSDRELEIVRKAARRELQKFLASRSIEVAKQSVTSQLSPEDDVRLIRERVRELREARG
jgi:F0F1-type ATP synthase membrane subunit b/b'